MRSTRSPLRVGMNLTQALDAALDATPRGIALVCGEQREDLRQIRAGGDRLARALAAKGVRAGDRVGLLVPNGIAFVEAVFGVWRLGAVVAHLDVRSTPGELAEMLAAAEVRTVVVDGDHRAAATERSLESVVVALVGRDRTLAAAETGFSSREDDEPLRRSGRLPDSASAAPRDLAVVFCTSGTTGRPKLVGHTHRTVIASTMALHRLHASFFDGTVGERARRVATILRRHGRRILRARGQQVWMTPIAFSSVSGHQVLLGALLGGHRLVTMRSFHPGVALEQVERERVNIMAVTPAMAELMLSVRSVGSFDPSSLVVVGLGGGPVPPELAQRVRDRFRCGIAIGYGSTELGGGVLVSRLEDPVEVQTGTVGRPFPGAEVEVVGDDGRRVADGDVGELRCNVPSAMAGYLDPTRASTDERDEERWYRTGDLATMDRLGNVRIVGRKTDMIIRGSQNVYPEDVERVLARLPAVERSAVVGVPGGPSGEQVWAFVTVVAGSTCTTGDVFAHCRDHLASYKVPDHICIRPALPMTKDGKVQKFLLTAEVRAGPAGPR
ncbi:MAG TPA: class I adenylate-forming enzyme family protein [Nocardioides sp.]|nr:class I adenylate-forming enzyme family protein [Nocardioides sp.]